MHRKRYRPLIPWNAPDGTKHDKVVWWARLHDRYLLEVRGTYTRCGELVIFDHRQDDEEIASWDVSVGLGPEDEEAAGWLKEAAKYVEKFPDGL